METYFEKGISDDTLLDENNPDPDLQDKPVLGLAFLYDLEFDKDSSKKGYLYSPNGGKIFYAKASFDKTDNILKLKTSIDSMGILGMTLKLERVPKAEAIKYTVLPRDQRRNPW